MENKTLPKAERTQGLSSFTFVRVSVLVGAYISLVCIIASVRFPFRCGLCRITFCESGACFQLSGLSASYCLDFLLQNVCHPPTSLMMQFLFKTWCRKYKIGWKVSYFKPRFDEDSIFGFRLPLNFLPLILALTFHLWKLGEGVYISILYQANSTWYLGAVHLLGNTIQISGHPMWYFSKFKWLWRRKTEWTGNPLNCYFYLSTI